MTRSLRRRLASACLVPAVALALSGCATTINPVTGESEFVGMSTEREIAVGREAAAQVKSEMGLVEDPALQAYVRSLGDKLAPYSPRKDVPFSFDVVSMPEPNAFALPGGHIYVSRGLLAIRELGGRARGRGLVTRSATSLRATTHSARRAARRSASPRSSGRSRRPSSAEARQPRRSTSWARSPAAG